MASYTYLTNQEIGDQSMEGYDCYDASGNKMGDVDGVIADGTMTPRYLVINSGGFFSTKQYVVPFGEIANVNDADKRVEFRTLSKDRLTSGSYPEYNDQWWETNDHAAWSGHERQVADAYAHDHSHERDGQIDYTSDLYTRQPENTRRLQLMEERLQANKQQVEAGRVTLGKRITEHTETMQVPVREERVIIERTPGDGRPAEGREFRDGETIDVPVMREEVQVSKDAVVREEVGIRKEATERTEQVQDTVRREELEVKNGKELVNGESGAMEERQRRMASPEGPRPTDMSEAERAGVRREAGPT